MRKIIVLLAAAAVSCLFTACGKVKTGQIANDTSGAASTSAADTTESDPVGEITTSGVVPDDAPVTEDECTEVLSKLFDAAASGDRSGMLRCCVPDEIYDTVEQIGLMDMMLGTLENNGSSVDFSIVEMKSAEPEEIRESELAYSSCIDPFIRLLEAGIGADALNAPTEEQIQVIEEIYDGYDSEGFPLDGKFMYEPKLDCYMKLRVKINGTDCEMGIFRTESGEVKVDFLTDYIKKSWAQTAKAAADNVFRAASAALADLDAEGAELGGVHLISSDSTKNIGDLNGKCDRLKEEMLKYFHDMDHLGSMFIVVNNGVCEYAACVSGSGTVGTYPPDTRLAGIDGADIELVKLSDGIDYSGLYDSAAAAVGQ